MDRCNPAAAPRNDQDQPILDVGGPKERAVLALLALHANEAVSEDRLADALWGG